MDFQSAVDKKTKLNQQRLILQLFGYRNCNPKDRQNLKTKTQQVAVLCGKPIYIFRELMHYLEEHHVVAPGYSFMQKAVGAAITFESNRLAKIVRDELQPSAVEALNLLMDDSEGLYEIIQLKREPKKIQCE